jgi:ankyrin repeat protein
MDEEEIDLIFRTVEGGDVDEVARLLDAEPHLMEARDPRSVNRTPLIMAAERGHVGMVRLLLERGADVHAGSEYGTTALHEAAAGGHEEVVSILLSHGADHSRKDDYGDTPLMTASIANDRGVVRQLLQVRECGLDERNNRGCTALWWACARGHVETARTLLLAGANHTLAGSGQTPRRAAEEYGHTECVALLKVSVASVHYHSQA